MNTPVMLLFFNRPEKTRRVFNWIKTVKPSQLFLVQDGPRDYTNDLELVLECRQIVENIDWECCVRRNYSEHNLSCDMREFTGIDWCFKYVDRLLILEDDCIPSYSFYAFCDEILERYKNDDRIGMISGFVRCGIAPNCEGDYTFSNTCAGWGWATWKRFWQDVKKTEEWPYSYYEKKLLDNKLAIENYNLSYKGLVCKSLKTRKEEIDKGKINSWENLVGITLCLNNYMAISPRVNMIKYIGIDKDATHSYNTDIECLPKPIKRMLEQDSIEIDAPIVHPTTIVRNIDFEKEEYRVFFGYNRILKLLIIAIKKLVKLLFR